MWITDYTRIPSTFLPRKHLPERIGMEIDRAQLPRRLFEPDLSHTFLLDVVELLKIDIDRAGPEVSFWYTDPRMAEAVWKATLNTEAVTFDFLDAYMGDRAEIKRLRP